MAVKGAQVTVANTATKVADELGLTEGREAVVANRGTASIFLGGPDVTTGTGYELKTTDGPIRVDLGIEDEQLYGIVATGTQRLDVLLV